MLRSGPRSTMLFRIRDTIFFFFFDIFADFFFYFFSFLSFFFFFSPTTTSRQVIQPIPAIDEFSSSAATSPRGIVKVN